MTVPVGPESCRPAAPAAPRNACAIDGIRRHPTIWAPVDPHIAVAVAAPACVGDADHNRKTPWVIDPIVPVIALTEGSGRRRRDQRTRSARHGQTSVRSLAGASSHAPGAALERSSAYRIFPRRIQI